MNRELNVQQIGKDILLQAGMGQEEIQKLADSDLPLNVQLINDFAFKKVFRNKKALTGLLSALLEIPAEQIVHLEFLDTLQLGNYRKDKKGILDIKVHLNNNRKINIEMQVEQEDYWKERSLFYLGRMYTGDLAAGEDYSLLEPCIHIGILAFDLPDTNGFYSRVRLMDEKTHQIYSDKMSLRVLYLNRLDQADEAERQTEVYRWAKLISARDWEDLRRIAMEDQYKAEAVKEMEKINADRKLRYEYISQEIARLDENTRRAEAHRKQEKARLEGRLEGRKEGRLEQSKVIALKLHQKGTSAGEIAEILDVPANQVSDWLRPGSSDTL